ncbi:hypothetical protein [Burkholderia sp. Ac-20379]|uniref:hypothetical protein n=1 Tax=Burkholderia sp. Ac-20379 TaxID=2703900 RepID=UPI0019806E7D|nr:hypothetical protein [Burkholderia sp. Ac-20379]MBN3724723.1 hypothetical protein [Burkholderia sp. Ac-20379]
MGFIVGPPEGRSVIADCDIALLIDRFRNDREIIARQQSAQSNRVNRRERKSGACRTEQACRAGLAALESTSGNGPHHRTTKIKMAFKYAGRGIKKTPTIFCLMNFGMNSVGY